jgi:cell division protein FtsI/penicillin-binding protein 2
MAPGSPAKPSRRSSPANRRAKRSRVAALAIIAIGVLVIGLATGFGSEPSAEPAAESFLLAWQQQHYEAAGALTTSSPRTVAAFLTEAFAQVDAAQVLLSMDSVVQHGGTARATFTVSVDLAQQGRVWTYHSQFGLRRVGSDWRVEWAPSVVNPHLGPGDRLAVVTEFPARAPVLDADGKPLQVSAPVYVVGVWPERLANQAATAQKFANLTGLVAGQVLGQIKAAPPHQFLKLASLDPATYASMRSRLRSVPGLVIQRTPERLFQSEASGLVGRVGSEVSPALRADGAYYAPGTTVGLSGLERTYQRDLLGTPATEVVAVNSVGAQTGVLAQWAGTSGTPVRTTIKSSVQNAALAALGSVPYSGEIVAVQASTGKVLAVAQRQKSGALPDGGPLNAKLMPGNAFTIVSAAALLDTGLRVSRTIPCNNSFTVGGQTFTSYGTGEQKPFSADFAEGCSTAFAGLSERLNAGRFAQVVKQFGIGADWSGMPVPAFSGSVPSTAGDAELAAETIGQGKVRVSLLSMAMVAAAVDTGSWHTPQVTEDASDPAGTVLNQSTMSALRGLMRGAVRSGAAKAASVPGAQVYGQVGMVHTSSGWMSWFVGYRGDIAFAAIETGKTRQLSAAALAGAFLSTLGP